MFLNDVVGISAVLSRKTTTGKRITAVDRADSVAWTLSATQCRTDDLLPVK